MCWFITIGVPARIAPTIGARSHGLDLMPFDGSPTAALFPAGLSCFVAMYGGCSCDLMEFRGSPPVLIEAKERERLARRGWSAAKIERAIASKKESLSRAVEQERGAGPAALRELVADLVRDAGGVHLLANIYSGNIETEQVEICAQTELTLAEFERSVLESATLCVVRGNA